MELTSALLETRSELDVVIDDKTDDETRVLLEDESWLDDKDEEATTELVIVDDKTRVDFDEDETTIEDLVCEDESKLELGSICDVDLMDDVARTDELFCSDEELEGIVIDVDLTELELLRGLEEANPVDEVRIEVINEDTVETFELACTVEDDQVM
jgi:hypothetical protein